MVIEIVELQKGSRATTATNDGKGDRHVRKFEISGTTSDLQAGVAIANSIYAPQSVLLHNNSTVTLQDIKIEDGGVNDRWMATLTWSNKPTTDDEDPNNPNPQLFSSTFDTGGGVFHVTQSKATNAYGPNSRSDKFKSAINVGRDGIPRGIDVVVPKLRIDRTVAYPTSYVTDSFIDTIADLTGKVNNGNFFGREPGEVLLMGASGENTGQPIVNISYSFEIGENESNLTVGGISGISKLAHEYLWVEYKDKLHANNGGKGLEPKAVYVEEVYPDGDFGLLGIPGA